jgi:hypothetical protein
MLSALAWRPWIPCKSSCNNMHLLDLTRLLQSSALFLSIPIRDHRECGQIYESSIHTRMEKERTSDDNCVRTFRRVLYMKIKGSSLFLVAHLPSTATFPEKNNLTNRPLHLSRRHQSIYQAILGFPTLWLISLLVPVARSLEQ